MTKVVHCKREKYDIYIGRPGPYGNKYVIGKDGNREEVIAKHKADLLAMPNLEEFLKPLIGKTLGCWCHPQPCHGDTYVELIQKLYNE